MAEQQQRDWTTAYTEVFADPASTVRARVWAQVLGEDYPAELDPHSYTSWSELGFVAREVQVARGDLLVDVGCGRGGPGLWVAARTGARYLGVDVAPPALQEVERRAARLHLDDRAGSAAGSFEQLPLDTGEVDAIMSIDALLFTPDKHAAVAEMARVLRHGGRLVATTWDYHSQPAGRPPQVPDHRPLLASAGFDVVRYDETPDWEARQREIDRLMLQHIEEVAAEAGAGPAEVRSRQIEMAATVDAMVRRVLVVAQRR